MVPPAPIQVILTGNNIDTLLVVAERVKATVSEVAGTREEDISVEGENPEIAISVDRQKMALFHLTMDQVGGTMQNAFAGNTD